MEPSRSPASIIRSSSQERSSWLRAHDRIVEMKSTRAGWKPSEAGFARSRAEGEDAEASLRICAHLRASADRLSCWVLDLVRCALDLVSWGSISNNSKLRAQAGKSKIDPQM